MKCKILHKQKNWRIYQNSTIAYVVINVPKGFKVKMEQPSGQYAHGDKIILYAYKK